MKKQVTYRKVGKNDGGELGKNLYRVTVAGVASTFSNSRNAKSFFRSHLKKVTRGMS